MKTLLSFTHPQFVSNTKEDILKNVGNQTADGPHSMKKKQKKKNMEANGIPSTAWLLKFFKIKLKTHTGLEQFEDEKMMT